MKKLVVLLVLIGLASGLFAQELNFNTLTNYKDDSGMICLSELIDGVDEYGNTAFIIFDIPELPYTVLCLQSFQDAARMYSGFVSWIEKNWQNNVRKAWFDYENSQVIPNKIQFGYSIMQDKRLIRLANIGIKW